MRARKSYSQFSRFCLLASAPILGTIAVFSNNLCVYMSDDHDDSVMDPNAIEEMAEDTHEDEDVDADGEYEEEEE